MVGSTETFDMIIDLLKLSLICVPSISCSPTRASALVIRTTTAPSAGQSSYQIEVDIIED